MIFDEGYNGKIALNVGCPIQWAKIEAQNEQKRNQKVQ